MKSEREEGLSVEQFEQIKGHLVQVKILLVSVLILMLLAIFGLEAILGFLGTSVVIAAIVLAAGYLLLLVLQRLLRWKTGPTGSEQLERSMSESVKPQDEENTG